MARFLKSRILVLTSIAHYINDGAAIAYATVYPLYVYMGYSYTDISIASALYLGTSSISSLFIGRIGDRVERPFIILAIGMILWSLAIAILGISISLIGSSIAYPLLIASTIVGGIASSIYHPIGAGILSHHFTEDRGLALGINGAMGAFGRSSYPVIITLLLTTTHIGLFPLALIPLLASIPMIALARIATKIVDMKSSTGSIPREVYMPIALLTIIAMARGIVAQGALTYLAIMVTQKLGIAYGVEVGLLTSLAMVGSIVSQPLLGVISDRLGRRNTMFLTTVMASLSLYGFIEFYRYQIALYLSLFLFGVFAFEAFTLLLAFVSDTVPQRYINTANSIVWGIGISAGGSMGPVIVGLIASHSSLDTGYAVIAFINLLTMPVIYIASRYAVTEYNRPGFHNH
ncbi:MAG: hypothetical protein DJ555_02590 [Desulfurococcaceae archaeon]|jgi:FSR family fosmidomycin resistance protein-like MFS transporter|nr:MAG: hypothetical protein DJ555_02590 [Desulfurococcaceae archaeon]